MKVQEDMLDFLDVFAAQLHHLAGALLFFVLVA